MYRTHDIIFVLCEHIPELPCGLRQGFRRGMPGSRPSRLWSTGTLEEGLKLVAGIQPSIMVASLAPEAPEHTQLELKRQARSILKGLVVSSGIARVL